MDFKEILKLGLDECMEDLEDALEGLTPEERRFQPTPDSNHIDFTVWHMARVEDTLVNRVIQHGEQIWERDKWYEKLGLPERGNGFRYTTEQVNNFPTFDFDGLMEYYRVVREDVLAYIQSISADDLDTIHSPERQPNDTIGSTLIHIVEEIAQHVGQVAYIRGIQRGLDK